MHPYEGEERRAGSCPAPGCRLPEAAADAAVKKVFAIFGVNIDDPQQVQQLQDLLRFLATAKRTISVVLVGSMTVATGSLTYWIIERLTG